jgi:hypothetical protein
MAKIYKYLTTHEQVVLITMCADKRSTDLLLNAIAGHPARSTVNSSAPGSVVYDADCRLHNVMPAVLFPDVFPGCIQTARCFRWCANS